MSLKTLTTQFLLLVSRDILAVSIRDSIADEEE